MISVCFGEILEHAEKIGYDWYIANRILVNDRIPHSDNFHISEFVDEDDDLTYSLDTIKIMTSFFVEKEVREIIVV